MRPPRHGRRLLFIVAPLLLLMGVGLSLSTSVREVVLTQATPPVPVKEMPESLKTLRPTEPSGMAPYVRDRQALLVLGKALFWDMGVGSDGVQACASCHFHAGTDSRFRNQLHPGADGRYKLPGPNGELTAAMFPLRRLADVDDKTSAVLSDSDDRVSSQGIALHAFLGVSGGDTDDGEERPDEVFSKAGLNFRRVEPRNTPTTINAVFNLRNFWDGRASATFNGADPFGDSSNAKILVKRPSGIVFEKLALKNASLASQAVGPPLSSSEMSFSSRQFQQLGRKLIDRRPLARQLISPTDSVLGGVRHSSGRGLDTTYGALIKAAFAPELWDSDGVLSCTPECSPQPNCPQGCGTDCSAPGMTPGQPNCREGYLVVQPPPKPGDVMLKEQFTLMQANFSVFFGIALMTYQSTLISDDAPYDRFREGDAGAISEAAKRGMAVFRDDGQCLECHNGPEFTSAASAAETEELAGASIERMKMSDGGVALYDNGFYNIGVRPPLEDPGIGGSAPDGTPLSFTARFVSGAYNKFNNCRVDVPYPNTSCTTVPPVATREKDPVSVIGAFKVPTLRNVELTGPYFHNGGASTLEQVVEFYSRGGDFEPQAPNIEKLGLSAQESSDLIAFLKTLTDDRVRYEKAPFDHPELCVPDGHPQGQVFVSGGKLSATTTLMHLPAVGAQGGAALHPFDTILTGSTPSHFDGVCPASVITP